MPTGTQPLHHHTDEFGNVLMFLGGVRTAEPLTQPHQYTPGTSCVVMEEDVSIKARGFSAVEMNDGECVETGLTWCFRPES